MGDLLAYFSSSLAQLAQWKETMKQIMKMSEHNMVKNPNWQEADQLVIYKRGREVDLGTTENNTS